MEQQFLFGLDVLNTTVSEKTNKISAQIGDAIAGDAEGDNVEWWQSYGLATRPPKPVPGRAAAQAIVIRRGSRHAAIASQDQRGLALYGLLDHGESCLYSAGDDGNGQARVLCKKDGSIAAYTTHDGTDQGRAVYSRVAPDGFSWVAPWGTMKFDATGFHLVHASGAAVDLGGIGGDYFPPGLAQISSYIKMRAGVISSQAAMQTNGVGGGSALAAAEPVMQAITALQVEVAALAAALVAVTNIPGMILPAHATAAAAGTVAVGIGATTVGTSTPRIPTTTTSA